jgi:hypothetical protein
LSFEIDNCNKKIEQIACHVVNSNIAIDSLPTLQISLGIVALFVNIHDEEPIPAVFSNIGVAIPLFQLPIFGNNY